MQIVIWRDAEDTKKYGSAGTINIGRHIVGTGEDSHFTTPVLMDILRPHLVVLCGKRGCVTKDTKILTDNGIKKINEVDSNIDKVRSFDLKTGEFLWKPS